MEKVKSGVRHFIKRRNFCCRTGLKPVLLNFAVERVLNSLDFAKISF
jgi:hypothetical protein